MCQVPSYPVMHIRQNQQAKDKKYNLPVTDGSGTRLSVNAASMCVKYTVWADTKFSRTSW